MVVRSFLRSGYRVVTTCSPKNFKLVKDYGAEKALIITRRRVGRRYGHTLRIHLSTRWTSSRNREPSASATRPSGVGAGRYTGFELLPEDLIATMRKTVKADWVMGLEATGVQLELPGGYYRKENPELHAWIHAWIKRFAALYKAGKINHTPYR